MQLLSRALLGLAAALLVAAVPAGAGDLVYPPNSRIGMVPPPGFVPSTKFPGFENPDAKAAILLLELPAEAFTDIEKGFTDEVLKSRGMAVELRDQIDVKDGRGFMVAGQQSAGGLSRREVVFAGALSGITALVSMQISEEGRASVSDATAREAFKTVVVRERIPDEEKLSVLPYTFSDLAGFRIVRGGQDGAALLTDGPNDVVTAVEQPYVLIGIAPAETPKPEERDAFARRVFSAAPGLKEVRITRAEPMRIGGMTGYEIIAEAKDVRSNTEINAVQWLRFNRGAYLQVFAIARRTAWNDVFPRLRALRDSIEPRQ